MKIMTNSPLMDKPYEPAKPRLTQNALHWPAAGVYLKSTHVHDYVSHSEVINGIPMSLGNDGGLEYRRTTFSGNPVYEDFSLWSDSSFDMVAERLLWGTHGPKGDQPLRWVPLKECETDHLQAILRTQLHVYGGVVEKVIKHWLKVRKVKPERLDAIMMLKVLEPFSEDSIVDALKKSRKKPAAKRKARK
jgi:hypothetical protein